MSAIDAARGEGYATGVKTEVVIARVRAEVAALHGELVRNGLVVWTGGNISERVPGADLFVIKPSGVSYDDLAPENMILCDLDGVVVADTPGSDRQPSSDTAAHAYVYRNMPAVGGIVHTHSDYATAWAARGEEIPCVLTAMADEFGGPIPVGPFAIIGDDSIGRASWTRSPVTARRRCSWPGTGRSRSGPRRGMRSRPRSCSRTSPEPCTSPASADRSHPCRNRRSIACTTGTSTCTASTAIRAGPRVRPPEDFPPTYN